MDVRSTPTGARVPESLATLLAASLARDISRRPTNARDFGRKLFATATESGLAPSELLPRSTLLGTRSVPRPEALRALERQEPTPRASTDPEPARSPPAPLRRDAKRPARFARIALVAACFALGVLGALGIATELGSCGRSAP
jgi:hypothetical protein